MNWKIFREQPLHGRIIFIFGILGYLLGIGVFLTGSLVMAGEEGSAQPILVFIFNVVARPFAVLVIFGPWGIGLGWAFLLVVAATCKRVVVLTIFFLLLMFAAVSTENQFPNLFSSDRWFMVYKCCTLRTVYLFVFPSLILISVFFFSPFLGREKKENRMCR